MISIKLQSNFIEIELRYWCSSVNLLHIFRTPFLNPILFGVSGVAYFIGWGGGGQKCRTFVFSKLEMVWQWNLAHTEAILCQVKINCEFSKWRIIFDGISTTLRNTVKFTIFWYVLLRGVVQSSPNTYFQKRSFLLANTAWKWQKVNNYWRKTNKKLSGIFFDMMSSKKGRASGLS